VTPQRCEREDFARAVGRGRVQFRSWLRLSRSLLAFCLPALGCGQKSGWRQDRRDDRRCRRPGARTGGRPARHPRRWRAAPSAAATIRTPRPSPTPVASRDAPAGHRRRRSRHARSGQPRDTAFTPVDGRHHSSMPLRSYDSGDLCTGVCQMYEDEYQAALVRARVCNPTVQAAMPDDGRNGVCAASAARCGSTRTSELDAIRMKWADAGCAKCARPCPRSPAAS
jgi:hypothetical protein